MSLLAVPSGASASFIVYGCGVNLCRVAPDGTGMRPVTTNGTPSANYHWPSLSRDGRRMTWLRGADLMLGDANAKAAVGPLERTVQFDVIRPDGRQVGALVLSSVFFGAYAYVYNADGTIAMNGPEPDIYSLGWAADKQHLLLPWNDPVTADVGICIAVKNPVAGWDCGTRLASQSGAYLTEPAVSPDGHVLAVTAKSGRWNTGGRIALFDYRSHRFLRNLTNGKDDALPQWSPDGSQVAFQRGSAIYVTQASASPGAERRLVSRGETPTWGGAPDPAASHFALARRQRGTIVRSRLTVRLAGSKIDARVLGTGRLRGRVLGRTVIRSSASGSRALAVRLSKSGRSALQRQRSLLITLRIDVTPPAGAHSAMSGTVTLFR